jgi:hypothetical protein
VIEHPDREHITALIEAARYFHVFLARRGIAGRMIVDEHDCSGGQMPRCSVHVAWPNQRRGQCSGRDYFVTVDPILVVERKILDIRAQK